LKQFKTFARWSLASLMLLLPLGVTQAVIEIEITQGGDNAISIAVVPFGWFGSGTAPDEIASIVTADLARSGNFAPIAREDLVALPTSGDVPRFANWRLSGADFLVIGSIKPNTGSAAHQIADEVYEEILGISGAFNTQIAFVSVDGKVGDRTYQLQLADADGENPQAMLTSPRPILSPSWAPDGVRIAYVSFENKTQSAVYVQDRQKGSRVKLISREGINGAPSWSPDGERLAVTLSYQGNPDIYVVQVDGGELTRITTSEAIDTEAVWIDNDTRTIAFVHGVDGGFQIAAIDRSSGLFQTLTRGTLDESPTFSPNGQMIMFATEKDGRGTLGAVSLDGSVVQSLTLSGGGSVREPVWSPYSQ